MSQLISLKIYIKVSTILILFTLFQLSLSASDTGYKNKQYLEYIAKYKVLAIAKMKQYNIPASITLSQGILESGAGYSDLAKKSNNHFGIKCTSEWSGGKVFAKDDTPNDCFRKYNKVEESYDDHSRFLVQRDRYIDLFSLNITDYKSWARGLQKAGYATDKAYANKLIKLIEDYELYLYDRETLVVEIKQSKTKEEIKYQSKNEEIKLITNSSEQTISTNNVDSKHVVYKTYGLVYVISKKNDNFESIAKEFDFDVTDLYRFNEVPRNFPLQEGDIVYFQAKRIKADKPYFEHMVKVGESMHSISQLYGIRVENLYRMNRKYIEYIPEEGDVLKLR